MTKNLDPWFKLLSSLASITFAGFAAFGISPIENLLWAILAYMWGRDD